MEEVRSYWQVTSIAHFCTLFGKPFKLPTFEPEELEQAFILEIPAPPTPITSNSNSIPSSTLTKINNHNHIESDNQNHRANTDDHVTSRCEENGNGNADNNIKNEENGEDKEVVEINNHDIDSTKSNNDPGRHGEDVDCEDDNKDMSINDNDDDEDYKPTRAELARTQFQPPPPPPQPPTDEQQELHLLVKLAIALLKPHFNCKISQANWENYLRRIVDSNWVELEHHPSPFQVPLISQDGVELFKNLTFNELPLSDKIDLFYALCDYRLWCEDAADAIRDYSMEELRLESIGKDSQGYEYWYFSGTRLFRENKELSQDIICRKKRIKELEYILIDLEKSRISKEKEEKRRAELERARQLAAEAREARNAAKKNTEQASKSRKKQSTPILPPRTGLRERRSSATSNNNDSHQARTPSTRSCKQQPAQQQNSQPKTTRSISKNSKHNDQRQEKVKSPDEPKKTPEEACKEEIQKLRIASEDRSEAWSLHCDSLESWESFATKFEKTKSTNEKYLSSYVNEILLPKIRAVYAKRAAEVRRKEKELMFSLTSRRVSTRIISKRAQEEEEERQAQLHEADMRRKKVEAETRLRAELEREMRARNNRFVINGGTTSSTCSEDGEDLNSRYKTRNQRHLDSSNEFDGIIHPDNLSDFYEALELVIDTVRTSKHAWPFVDPVPETVPNYYDLIKEPMDLRKLRTKIEFREYKSLIELEKDFQLLVNNCERFNGPKNVYTKMVYKLWKSFRKNVRLYLQRDLSMDEYETFVYPPPPPPPPPKEEPPEPRLAPEDPSPALESKASINLPEVKAPSPIPPAIPSDLAPAPAIAKPEPITEEIITEEIIIDSYDVTCPDDNFFIWPQEATETNMCE